MSKNMKAAMSDRMSRPIARSLCGVAGLGSLALGVGFPSLAAESAAGGAAARGAEVYGQYCASCHGANLVHPSGSASFDLRTFPTGGHDRFVAAVLNGKGAMPPWDGTVTKSQVEDLWAYVSASKTKPAATKR